MDILVQIFGEGRGLGVLQMCSRSVVIFIIAWILIRIAGRRSFGQGKALDNVVVILLGSILGRAVAGISPFIPTVAACFVFALLHRVCAWIGIRYRGFSKLINGERIEVYRNGVFSRKALDRALVHEDDVYEQVRLKLHAESINDIDVVYMEKNGELSAVKKGNSVR